MSKRRSRTSSKYIYYVLQYTFQVYCFEKHRKGFLNVEHHFHSSYQKSIIERTIQYIKDRTKCFDDYFPCRKDNNDCKLKHVMNWLGLFVDMHNREVMEKIVSEQSPLF
jgi:hypothetical protein